MPACDFLNVSIISVILGSWVETRDRIEGVRSRSWLKVKTKRYQETVIGGRRLDAPSDVYFLGKIGLEAVGWNYHRTNIRIATLHLRSPFHTGSWTLDGKKYYGKVGGVMFGVY